MPSVHCQSGRSADDQPGSSCAASTGYPLRGPLLLLADDLTGACDSGLAFAKQGLGVSVLWFPAEEMGEVEAGVVAVSVQTRDLPAEAMRCRMEDLARRRSFAEGILFHKVDSAGRGNPGAEMLVLAALGGCDSVVYAPAFPIAGRIVLNGRLRVSDFCGQQTEVDLLQLLPAEARERVARIPVCAEDALRRQMLAAHAAGKDIWLCDAMEQQDLDRVAAVAWELPLQLQWSGSAGLAAAVAGRVSAASGAGEACPVALPADGRTLVIAGTDHPVTVEQLRRLAPHAAELSIEEAAPAPEFACGLVRVDWSTATAQGLRGFWQRAQKAGHAKIDTLVLTGGDTAAFVLESLGAESLELRGEVELGIPWSVVRGGLADGCMAMTKSGGFGREESLTGMVEFCRRMRA